MPIRNVVTRGFGNGTFSPGVKWVVTRGYSIDSVVIIFGPFHAEAMQVFLAGMQAGDVYLPEAQAGDVKDT